MITLAGLRQLRLMQRKGESMPEGWKDDVRTYLLLKSKMLEMHKRRMVEVIQDHPTHKKNFPSSRELIEKCQAQLKEARSLARLLGVQYVRN